MAADMLAGAYAMDVTSDGRVTPLDALVVINNLNAHGSHAVSEIGDPCDVNLDHYVSAVDALMVVNELNNSNLENPADVNAEAMPVTAVADSTRMYLKLPNITGDVAAKGYQGWIEVKSVWQEYQRVLADDATGSTISRAQTLQGDMHIVTSSGQALPQLALSQLKGELLVNAELHVVQQLSSTGAWVATAKTVLDRVMVSTADMAVHTGAEPAAGFTLSFEQLTTTYYRVDPTSGKLTVSGTESINGMEYPTLPVGSGIAENYDELQHLVADEGLASQARILFRIDGMAGDTKGWMELQSFSQQFDRTAVDSIDSRQRTTTSADRIEFELPRIYPMLNLLNGAAHSGELRVERWVNGAWTTVAQWELTDFVITEVKSSGKPGKQLTNHVALNVDSFKITSYTLDPATQKVVGQSSMSWSNANAVK
jgi:type VI protein secretion system component Hcp